MVGKQQTLEIQLTGATAQLQGRIMADQGGGDKVGCLLGAPAHSARRCGVTKTPVLGLSAKGLASCSGSCPGDSWKVNLQ